ncbi:MULTISPECIES: Sec-independent protein translocase subunit TatA [Microbacterium]|uniref:Sec-independent protein translocase protein TatA n=1 Tax=Microbacterium algihabitans TaxID=3075992 RepID=A0ABU3RYD7_9MICO|nr:MULTISPECIES: Sec-independent protein translocase subunit TatA [Microbacterium]MCD2169740.1 Sec-independent protein translocase subunit TatA [Microbacterium sp. JC 701]MCM3501964.1 Sec-independent protein translocase subunit TatA [Microbacterium sp. P26]MDQ1173703.1 sec-independent protein translocase protein TatA [Microbacterium testaceum]MDU0327814.1 Sec-independent protein translocase subunit TatA [Microbacterium sp. KSW2-21]
MLQGLTGWHLLAVLAVILLLFGAAKLPALAKSMGQSARVFKSEMKEMKRDDEVAAAPEAPRATDAGTAPSVAPEPRRSTDPTV